MAKTRQRRLANLWDVQKGLCFDCGRFVAFRRKTFEHLIPVSRDGTIATGVMACKPCNGARGNSMPSEYDLARALRINCAVTLMVMCRTPVGYNPERIAA